MLRSHKSDILRVAKAHGASNVRVFGSVARGTATPTSDVDLLVDFQSGRTLVDHVRIWRELEARLGTGVISAGGITERDNDIRAHTRRCEPTKRSSWHREDRRYLLDAAAAAAEIGLAAGMLGMMIDS